MPVNEQDTVPAFLELAVWQGPMGKYRALGELRRGTEPSWKGVREGIPEWRLRMISRISQVKGREWREEVSS